MADWKIAAAAALAATSLVSAVGFTVALAAPLQEVGPFSNLNWVHEIRAERALSGGDDEAALRHSDASIGQAPMTAHAWARHAYIHARREDAMGPRAVEALAQSYAVAPYGPGISRWRVRFALDHWRDLPPDLQRSVWQELEVQTRFHRRRVRTMRDQIADPSGRMMVIFALSAPTRRDM